MILELIVIAITVVAAFRLGVHWQKVKPKRTIADLINEVLRKEKLIMATKDELLAAVEKLSADFDNLDDRVTAVAS